MATRFEDKKSSEFYEKYKGAYDRWQENYNDRWLQSRTLEPPYQLAVAIESNSNKGDVVLEVGCSEGYNLNFLHEIGYSKLYGIDIHKESLVDGRKKYPNLGESRLQKHDITKGVPKDIKRKLHPQPSLIFTKSCLQQVPHEDIHNAVKNVVKTLSADGIIILYETKFKPSRDRCGLRKTDKKKNHHIGIKQNSTVFYHDYDKLFSDQGFEVWTKGNIRICRRPEKNVFSGNIRVNKRG